MEECIGDPICVIVYGLEVVIPCQRFAVARDAVLDFGKLKTIGQVIKEPKDTSKLFGRDKLVHHRRNMH